MLEDTVVNRTAAELAVSRGEKLLDIAQCEYAPGRACDYRSFELKCGHTECYPTNLTDRITKRVNALYEIKQQELKESYD